MSQPILIVEDDPYITKFMKMALEEEGYELIHAESGQQALQLFQTVPLELIILDLGLPDMDGLDLIRQFRENTSVPIIVVSARIEETEKIKALDLGANDYVTKPFYMGELLARIRVARRLKADQAEDYFEKDDLRVDFKNRAVTVNGKNVHLTPMEYSLLKLLIDNRGKVLTHNFLQREIWGYVDQSNQNALRVFMATLRKKIEKDTNHPRFIITEVGVGYRFINDREN